MFYRYKIHPSKSFKKDYIMSTPIHKTIELQNSKKHLCVTSCSIFSLRQKRSVMLKSTQKKLAC